MSMATTKTSHPSAASEFWYYFSRNKGAVIGLAIFLIILVVAIFAPFVAPHSPSEQNREALLMPPVLAAAGSGPIFSARMPSAAISCRG